MMVWIGALLFLVLAVAVLTLIFKMSQQLNDRLNQMNLSLLEANKAIGSNLSGATTVFGTINEKLGRLEESNAKIYEVGKDIASLQDLLRAPKFRGAMGELLLEGLLQQVLPKEGFETQYRFKSGDAVDAVIRLGGKLVPVDAKFSLENFSRMVGNSEEASRNAFRKKFLQDVKVRIDEIASKYILPDENTFDFALMYIPAENVYYEVMISEDVFSYGVGKKVFAVSPNTFYAYLQLICLGLRGLKIEEHAQEILKGLGGMTTELAKFKEEFDTLGGHITSAHNKYDDSLKKLERFSDRLTRIQDTGK